MVHQFVSAKHAWIKHGPDMKSFKTEHKQLVSAVVWGAMELLDPAAVDLTVLHHQCIIQALNLLSCMLGTESIILVNMINATSKPLPLYLQLIYLRDQILLSLVSVLQLSCPVPSIGPTFAHTHHTLAAKVTKVSIKEEGKLHQAGLSAVFHCTISVLHSWL